MIRTCLRCQTSEGMTRFEDEPFIFEQAGMKRTLDGLSGRRRGTCGKVEFDAENALRYAAAGDALVRSEREAPEWIEAVPEFDNDAVP
jgi:hypothetical protein